MAHSACFLFLWFFLLLFFFFILINKRLRSRDIFHCSFFLMTGYFLTWDKKKINNDFLFSQMFFYYHERRINYFFLLYHRKEQRICFFLWLHLFLCAIFSFVVACFAADNNGTHTEQRGLFVWHSGSQFIAQGDHHSWPRHTHRVVSWILASTAKGNIVQWTVVDWEVLRIYRGHPHVLEFDKTQSTTLTDEECRIAAHWERYADDSPTTVDILFGGYDQPNVPAWYDECTFFSGSNQFGFNKICHYKSNLCVVDVIERRHAGTF